MNEVLIRKFGKLIAQIWGEILQFYLHCIMYFRKILRYRVCISSFS